MKGSFLFTYYFLLNEEVRKYLKDRKKKQRFKSKEKNLSSNLKNIQDLMIRNEERHDDDEEECDDESQLFNHNKEHDYLIENDDFNENDVLEFGLNDDFSSLNVSNLIPFLN